MTTAGILDAIAAGVRIIDLGRPMFNGMPQSPNHPRYWHSLPRRHGDMVRADGGSAANDIIVTGTHVGTHIDALAHVSHDGRMFGERDARAAQVGGRFMELGIHTVEPWLCRGVLLDITAVIGEEICPGGHEVTVEQLEDAVARQGTEVRPGDVLLIRTGWGRLFDDHDAFVGDATGSPGVGEAGARWIAAKGVRAAGGETIAFERTAPGEGHALLPAHRVLLVEHGIHILEAVDLEELWASGVREFVFGLAPLKLLGATGSPVRPFAVVSDD